uniref:Uncharacterized protein n=1 Tax=Glossina pallidipes TaxID=7398 RepID=A0A1B0AE49_GLOPL
MDGCIDRVIIGTPPCNRDTPEPHFIKKTSFLGTQISCNDHILCVTRSLTKPLIADVDPNEEDTLPFVINNYKKIMRDDIEITGQSLTSDLCGGIGIIALSRHVKVPNTLETRLNLLAQQLVP